ncbi:MAG TPA: hypothetical protein VKN82_04960 [Desulfohalobiaceae bacterium]|nr:hypothetical protein [Desulfohalobiaceae bacterium]
MIMKTASEAISFSKELEEKAAAFYEALAQKFSERADEFQAMAKENKKMFEQIHRSYIGVITDAIEGCYAVNIESEDYNLDTEIPDKADLSEMINKAEEIENTIIKFYELAAEQSQSVMADVPRTFKIVVKKKRNKRLPKLEELK